MSRHVAAPTPRAPNACPAPYTQAEIQTRLDASCSSCHGASGGYMVSTPFTTSTVGIVSTGGAAPAVRIRAGDHRASVLWLKLNGTQTVGGRMPAGGPFWSSSDLWRLAQYIDSL